MLDAQVNSFKPLDFSFQDQLRRAAQDEQPGSFIDGPPLPRLHPLWKVIYNGIAILFSTQKLIIIIITLILRKHN